MVALDDLDVLEPMAMSPEVSLTTKLALARLNRLARNVVAQHLRGNCILVHDEDAIIANVPFVRAWLRACPGAVLKVHGHDGEMKLGEALQVANTHGNTIFSDRGSMSVPAEPGYFKVGPIFHSQTAAFFLAHVLAKTWARIEHAPVQQIMGTVAKSMPIMVGQNICPDYKCVALVECDRALRFHNAMFRTEKRIVVDNDHKYANEQLRNRLQPWCEEARQRFLDLSDRTVKRMETDPAGTVHLANLHLTDDAMTVIGPRVRALAAHVTQIKAHNNRFDLRGATALFAEPHQQGDAHAPRWPLLRHLDLSSTSQPLICFDGSALPPLCSAIARKHMPELWCLDLSNTGMGDVGARLVFATLRHLPILNTLYLSQNPISYNGLNTLVPMAAAGDLVDGTRVARTSVIAPELRTLSMIDMPKMGKAAWIRLGNAILGGGFPNIETLRTENPNTLTNRNRTFERTRPAMLAVAAVSSRRIADNDHKRALNALNEPSKSAKKKMKKKQEGTGAASTVP